MQSPNLVSWCTPYACICRTPTHVLGRMSTEGASVTMMTISQMSQHCTGKGGNSVCQCLCLNMSRRLHLIRLTVRVYPALGSAEEAICQIHLTPVSRCRWPALLLLLFYCAPVRFISFIPSELVRWSGGVQGPSGASLIRLNLPQSSVSMSYAKQWSVFVNWYSDRTYSHGCCDSQLVSTLVSSL